MNLHKYSQSRYGRGKFTVEQTDGTDLCFPCRTMRQAQRDLHYRPSHHRINNPFLPSTNVFYPARICSANNHTLASLHLNYRMSYDHTHVTKLQESTMKV